MDVSAAFQVTANDQKSLVSDAGVGFAVMPVTVQTDPPTTAPRTCPNGAR